LKEAEVSKVRTASTTRAMDIMSNITAYTGTENYSSIREKTLQTVLRSTVSNAA
jgi:hypothetical protein